ncbi:MAG: LysR family transcriptional regulator, partial [Actinomycetales bacterium]
DLGFIEVDERPEGLEVQVFGRDLVVACVSPAHRWAGRTTPVGAAELAEESWVLRERGSGTRDTFERALDRDLDVALEVSSTMVLVNAALGGLGPAVVAERAVAAELAIGSLVRVPTELELARPLAAVWRPDYRPTDAARDLLARLRADPGVAIDTRTSR